MYNVFVCLLMLLVGAVFIYTPGDLLATEVVGVGAQPDNAVIWIIYAVILLYYVVATLFPIDKIIGKVYPIFGAVLLLSAVGVFIGIFTSGYQLQELSAANWMGLYPKGESLIPAFFVTVACGIVSGFHSTQSTLIARSVTHEKEGKSTFFYMMLLEGFIAMTWAAAAMGIYSKGVDAALVGQPDVIGLVAKDLLGPVGAVIAIIGVIVLPITSGDTALRSLRLMIGDFLHIDQKPRRNRILITLGIFIPVIAILVFAKLDKAGFQILWRYFAWSNQTIAVFAFAMITIYLVQHRRAFIIALLPGIFYCFVIVSYIFNAKIGFNLPMPAAYAIAAALSAGYAWLTVRCGMKKRRAVPLP